MTALAPTSGRLPKFWPGIIFGLIGLNMCIVAVTVFYATRDPSVATEPDYYAKALHYDQTIMQREANTKLGWSAMPTLEANADRSAMNLVVILADTKDQPVPGAHVTAVAFASARSGQRQALSLVPVEGQAGKYAAPVSIDRPGVWELRITALRGDDTFTRETNLMVPGLTK
jgi:nitrogen fixation protein FixH